MSESLSFGVREAPAPYQAQQSGYSLALADPKRGLFLYHRNCIDVMETILAKYPNGCFDMIFADPPYGLSNDGFTCVAGKIASVNKGDWDRASNPSDFVAFTRTWLSLCQRLLTKNGTLWVSGTRHNIYTIGHLMGELGLKVLNDIVWEKPNPPPNLSCRYFTHSSEIILWAAKNAKSRHLFNYADMRAANGGKQMKSVWRFMPPGASEKRFGKHPTQKPVALLERIIAASTMPGAFVFDPFAGSSTTGVAALELGRAFCGVESEAEFVALSKSRLQETRYAS
jgi:site-specific DNA-methyltransferase (adenine-specific)